MAITCPFCRYENLDDTEYCEACGVQLPENSTSTLVPESASEVAMTLLQEESFSSPTFNQSTDYNPTVRVIPPSDPSVLPVSSTPSVLPVSSTLTASARLLSKQPNTPIQEFPLDPSNLIGVFDPDMGPVEIDLEDFPGCETVSRRHAEIFWDGTIWRIKDLGSTNGTFLKRAGQSSFGARITVPEILNSGDEVAIAKIRFIFQCS